MLVLSSFTETTLGLVQDECGYPEIRKHLVLFPLQMMW